MDAINCFPDGKATVAQGQKLRYLLWPSIVASFTGICTPEEWKYRKYLMSVHTSSTLIWRCGAELLPGYKTYITGDFTDLGGFQI